MDTATLPRVEPADTDDPAVHHWWHCRPDVAFCGADLTGHTPAEYDENHPGVCPLCRIADECGHYCPACRKPVTT